MPIFLYARNICTSGSASLLSPNSRLFPAVLPNIVYPSRENHALARPRRIIEHVLRNNKCAQRSTCFGECHRFARQLRLMANKQSRGAKSRPTFFLRSFCLRVDANTRLKDESFPAFRRNHTAQVFPAGLRGIFPLCEQDDSGARRRQHTPAPWLSRLETPLTLREYQLEILGPLSTRNLKRLYIRRNRRMFVHADNLNPARRL